LALYGLQKIDDLIEIFGTRKKKMIKSIPPLLMLLQPELNGQFSRE